MSGYTSTDISRFDDPSWYLQYEEVEEIGFWDRVDMAYEEERESRSE